MSITLSLVINFLIVTFNLKACLFVKFCGTEQYTRVIPQIKCSLNQKCLDTHKKLKKKGASQEDENAADNEANGENGENDNDGDACVEEDE